MFHYDHTWEDCLMVFFSEPVFIMYWHTGACTPGYLKGVSELQGPSYVKGHIGVSDVRTGATVTENEIRCYLAMFEQRDRGCNVAEPWKRHWADTDMSPWRLQREQSSTDTLCRPLECFHEELSRLGQWREKAHPQCGWYISWLAVSTGRMLSVFPISTFVTTCYIKSQKACV